MKKHSGFTLIELMMVVAIISVILVIGVPSMLRARQAANEASAVACCKSLATGEEIYVRSDRNGDGVLEYATAMRGTNSLLETNAGTGDLAIIDSRLAVAEGEPDAAISKNGYVFKILTAQGPSGSGGARSFMANNGRGGMAMVQGFAIASIPDAYDISGRMSFVLGPTGTVLQKDRGTTGVHETWYNPDDTWSPCE